MGWVETTSRRMRSYDHKVENLREPTTYKPRAGCPLDSADQDFNLNRITQAYTTGNSPLATSWGESFTIDPWGNLTNKPQVTVKTNTEPLNAAPASIKNQLNGFCHDAAGNLGLNTPGPRGSLTPTYAYRVGT